MSDPLQRDESTRVGLVLDEKYRVIRELGRGGVGKVLEVEHLRLRSRLALKILDPAFVSDRNIVDRFEREARAMASLKSPHIAAVTDVDALSDGTPYIVMELLEGQDYAALLRERGILSSREAVELVIQACEGLEAVHAAGIVHRDLKPSNLFLVPSPSGSGSFTLKVMDFGISKFEGDDVTQTGSSLGTPAYMSPEQVRSPRDVDVRTDLWSIGVILFRSVAGTLPFEGEGITGMSVAIVNEQPKRLGDLRPDLPPPLIAVVDRLLAKDREARFPDVASLKAELALLLPSLPMPPSGSGFDNLPTELMKNPMTEFSSVEPGAPVLDSFVRASASKVTTPEGALESAPVSASGPPAALTPSGAPPPTLAAVVPERGPLVLAGLAAGALTLMILATAIVFMWRGEGTGVAPPPVAIPPVEATPAPAAEPASSAAPDPQAPSPSPTASASSAPARSGAASEVRAPRPPPRPVLRRPVKPAATPRPTAVEGAPSAAPAASGDVPILL